MLWQITVWLIHTWNSSTKEIHLYGSKCILKFQINLMSLKVPMIVNIIVAESDILGPNDYLIDMENLVSFERAMYEDYRFKHKMKIFLFL